MRIAISGRKANLVIDDTLIQNSKRTYTVLFEFDEEWDGYTKTAVFHAGSVTESVSITNDRCVIPPLCLNNAGVILDIGVYGMNQDLNDEIETVWCRTSRILYRSHLDLPDIVGAIHSGELVDHVAKFYVSPDKSGTPAFTMVLPEEMFLDQAETRFVENFVWSAATYPGSTNPNLDGKPVFVLAVKSEDVGDNPSYSFLNMQTLVDTYSGASGDGSSTVTVSGYQISVNVNLSTQAGNIITKDSTGKLYAAHQDISNKSDKPSSASANNLVAFDANKNPVDSNIPKTNVQQKLSSGAFASGNIRVSDANGFAKDSGIAATSLLPGVPATDAQVERMLDEVFGS